jgi:hypothetical protein
VRLNGSRGLWPILRRKFYLSRFCYVARRAGDGHRGGHIPEGASSAERGRRPRRADGRSDHYRLEERIGLYFAVGHSTAKPASSELLLRPKQNPLCSKYNSGQRSIFGQNFDPKTPLALAHTLPLRRGDGREGGSDHQSLALVGTAPPLRDILESTSALHIIGERVPVQ